MELDLTHVGDEHVCLARLSRRNLKALLVKLDTPGSRRTLYKTVDSGRLTVMAEEDHDHYIDREPGKMHPNTEAKLAASE